MGTWKINFTLPARMKRFFFFNLGSFQMQLHCRQPFVCERRNHHLFVREENGPGKIHGDGQPFGQQTVDIGGTSQSGIPKFED